jgi:sirohydrochlorin cobaltochelatase
MAKFIGIGVGPGDPELITVKAIKALEVLDILVVPSGKEGSSSEALAIAESYVPLNIKIIKRVFPMTNDAAFMSESINEIADEISSLVLEGFNVGFLTLGDPMLYSTYGYLLKRLINQIPISTIAGITSYTAIASGENRILTEGDTPLVIYPCVGELKQLETHLTSRDSLVLMKVYKSFEKVKQLIIKHGLSTNALIVSNYGKPNAVVFSDIEQVNQEDLSYFTTILIYKGV